MAASPHEKSPLDTIGSADLPPGTFQLIDGAGKINGSHATGKGQEDIVLVPRPSADPEDPLNWAFKRKVLATSCVILYTITIAIPSSAVYSIVTPLRKATHLDLQDINNGTGIMFLFYGWGCVFWQAMALQYGKRPVYLLTLLASVVVLATAPLCRTAGPYLANRIILGFFGSPVESLVEITITDLWFSHERPKYLAWYGWALALCGKLAPMLSGFINFGMGWEWTLYWCAIWNGMCFVYCFFLLEETNYDRKHVATRPGTPSVIESTLSQKEGAIGTTLQVASSDAGESGEIQWPRKTYAQKLALLDKPRPNRLVNIMIAPFKGFTYPAVVYAGLMYGANSLVWSGFQNATIGTVYTTKYGFNTAGTGGAYAGAALGTILGGYYCGKLGPMLMIRMARRNNGISEPEHGLYLFIISVVIMPIAMLVYGLGVTYHWHWMALVFTQFLLAINSAVAVAGALNYAIGSYRELSSDMVTTCVLIRNTMSFAINFGITPWLKHSGYLTVYCIIAGVALVWNGSIFVMTRYGRALRERTGSRYWRQVEHARSQGLSH